MHRAPATAKFPYKKPTFTLSSLAEIDDCDDGAATMGALMHRVDRNEDSRVPDGAGRHAAHGSLRMAMMVNI